MNILSYLPTAFAIIEQLGSYDVEFEAGVPVVIAPIFTYIGSKHVQVNITVTPIPAPVAAVPVVPLAPPA